ncbi:MAG: hypothetical protein AAF902_02990 [Chloroflexota bacterium]
MEKTTSSWIDRLYHTREVIGTDPITLAYVEALGQTDALDRVPRFVPGGRQHLTVLSFGAGQDSTAILYRLIFEPQFAAEHIPGELAVCIVDTGNEHPATLAHVDFCEALCAAAGVPFRFLQVADGYHSEKWQTLTQFYESKQTIGSKAFPKTCTSNLKLDPFYRWLNEFVAERLSISDHRLKRGLYGHTQVCGPVSVWIGIAADEDRQSDPAREPVWMIPSHKKSSYVGRSSSAEIQVAVILRGLYPHIYLCVMNSEPRN